MGRNKREALKDRRRLKIERRKANPPKVGVSEHSNVGMWRGGKIGCGRRARRAAKM